MPATGPAAREPRRALRGQGSLPQALSARGGAGRVEPADFSVARDGYGAPQIVCGPRRSSVLDRQRSPVALSLTHDRASASAVALALPATIRGPLAGRFIARSCRCAATWCTGNLRRVYGERRRRGRDRPPRRRALRAPVAAPRRVLPLPLAAAGAEEALVRVEGHGRLHRRARPGKGILILTGHFGNWEVSTTAGHRPLPGDARQVPLRAPADQADWLDAGHAALQAGRFRRVLQARLARRDARPPGRAATPSCCRSTSMRGRPTASRSTSSATRLDLQEPGDHRAGDRRAGAAGLELARAGRTHVLRFEAAAARRSSEDTNEAIRRNTRAYNAALERLIVRHPEQWYWVHRRWKHVEPDAGALQART